MISRFIGEYSFLDLNQPLQYTLYDVYFRTLRHYYYAFKCQSLNGLKIVANSMNPELTLIEYSKKYNHYTRSDWKDVRYDILSHGVYMRYYSDYFLQQKLLSTNTEELIYGLLDIELTEDQLFLGYSLANQTGFNALGKILMYYREYFRSLNENLRLNTENYPEMVTSKTDII